MSELINIYPKGIDWTKEDVVRWSECSKEYIRDGKRLSERAAKAKKDKFFAGLSENYVIASTYGADAVEVEVVDNEYISFREFYVPYRPYSDQTRVVDAIAEYGCNLGKLMKIEAQIRVYKDKKSVNLYKLTDAHGKVEYRVANKKYYSRGLDVPYLNGGNIDRTIDGNKDSEKLWVVVTSDEQIREHAVASSKSNNWFTKSFRNRYSLTSSSMEKGKKIGGTYVEKEFSDELTDRIEQFFEYNSEEHAIEKEMLGEYQEYICYGKSIKPDKNRRLDSPYLLSIYIGYNNAVVKNYKSKKEKTDSIWPTVHWLKNGVTWERRGDLIICSRYFKRDNWESKDVITYNVKTKKRNFFEHSGEIGKNESVQCQVPSIGLMARHFKIDYIERTWNTSKRKYETKGEYKQEFIGASSARELFDGTNVAWMIDNKELFKDSKVFSIGDCPCDDEAVEFEDQISDKACKGLAVYALVTTGDPLLEQLLKTRQFNIYLEVIRDKIHNQSCPQVVVKKGGNDGKLIYDPTESSLKKMLGMTMQQIQIINKVAAGKSFYEFPDFTPKILPMLGVKSFTEIDIESFEKLAVMRKEPIRDLIRKENVRKVVDKMNLKDKIDFIEKYEDSMYYYEDYLKMRNTMKKLMAKDVAKYGVFDEKAYPEKIQTKAARKFFRYVEGMRLPGSSSIITRITSEEEFKYRISETYGEYSYCAGAGTYKLKQNNIHWVKEGKSIVGAIVELNLEKQIRYLHDEITSWYNLYKDEAQEGAFREAVGRVKKLEWEDPSSDLCIIAPVEAKDLREEGSTLEHCVASFVEPIINGTDNVMFIRRKGMIAEPYITLDIDPEGNIRQVHCQNNGGISEGELEAAYKRTKREVYNKKENVVAFLKRWAKAMNSEGNTVVESTIKSSYGIAGALRR